MRYAIPVVLLALMIAPGASTNNFEAHDEVRLGLRLFVALECDPAMIDPATMVTLGGYGVESCSIYDFIDFGGWCLTRAESRLVVRRVIGPESIAETKRGFCQVIEARRMAMIEKAKR